MKKQSWAWVGVVCGLIGIGGKIATTSAFVQDIASRVFALERAQGETKEDVKYIRSRVDAIYDRLPPCGQCKE